jgi:hypothetical protein
VSQSLVFRIAVRTDIAGFAVQGASDPDREVEESGDGATPGELDWLKKAGMLD